MTRALEPSEIAVYGADAVIDPVTNEPISRSSMNMNANHRAALERSEKVAAIGAIPSEAAFKQMLELFQASTDAKAHAEFVRRLQEVAATARTEVAKAAQAGQERIKQLAAMAGERAALQNEIASERAKFEQECARVRADLSAREAGVAKREAELKASRAKLQEQLADVDKRLGLIRQAAR